MSVKISYEEFLYYFQNSKTYNVDESVIFFDDDPENYDHFIGYIERYKEPYWVGRCDVEGGCDFRTAEELFTAKIFDGRSMKDRWEHLYIMYIGCLAAEDWLDIHRPPQMRDSEIIYL